MELSMYTISWFLPTLRLVFIFSLDNSGTIVNRKCSWLIFCSRGRTSRSSSFVQRKNGYQNSFVRIVAFVFGDTPTRDFDWQWMYRQSYENHDSFHVATRENRADSSFLRTFKSCSKILGLDSFWSWVSSRRTSVLRTFGAPDAFWGFH
jgi:hypothetical protein